MTFREQKKGDVWHYDVEDVFGIMEFTSPQKLNAEKLDDVFMAVFQTHKNDTAKTITGTIKGTNIGYRYVQSSPWITDKKT